MTWTTYFAVIAGYGAVGAFCALAAEEWFDWSMSDFEAAALVILWPIAVPFMTGVLLTFALWTSVERIAGKLR